VTVPLVRSDPAAGTIDLRYVRFPATGADPGSPIVYLAGGPGGSGIDAFRGSRQSFYLSLREIADVIAFDQRGTGDSEPEDVLCEHERGLPLDRPGSACCRRRSTR
jgi:pimeloyl-ACP methyl ester carboxylesterase